jgi:hypothetical protein
VLIAYGFDFFRFLSVGACMRACVHRSAKAKRASKDRMRHSARAESMNNRRVMEMNAPIPVRRDGGRVSSALGLRLELAVSAL